MNGEVIYEKKYPRLDLPEVEDDRERHLPDAETFRKRLLENRVLVPLPQRRKSAQEFICTAIEVSQQYEFDTKIERHDSHIAVTYSFDCGGGIGGMGKLLGMADELSFFKDILGADITIGLDYYTHAVIRRRRRGRPE